MSAVTLIYSLETSGQVSERAVVRWGLSRFGDREDPEMHEAVKGDNMPGNGLAVYTGWTPKPIVTRPAEQIHAQRVRKRSCLMRNPKAQKPQSAAQRKHRKKLARKNHAGFVVGSSDSAVGRFELPSLIGRAANRPALVPCSRCHPNWLASRVTRSAGTWHYLCCGAEEPQLEPAA